ncbi:type IV pilin N-terminal domain-containing protein [Haloterrigena salifodinae]|uniref:Type IV pilin N-terminal domain-containing protein n=1 Tax=Haloterrigena salifodinae TaxID=2675099 RepID=A0A8T8DVR2_9EURY|nr:type IV pilin N-terminal domain-containing protein [Haloterrigena salifodinae]QRV13629.1 type IV pilin N-terminal domain-containing protein [Haloterrigena salifodinae]
MPADSPLESSTRAVAPIIGVLALLAITVALAATIAVGMGFAGDGLLESSPNAAFGLEADADRSELTLEHVGGDSITVTDLELQIAVNGDRLEHQPPVPFVGANGYRGAPSGPFNPETDPEWQVGETATLRVAGTNDPTIRSGDTVSVTVVVDDTTVTRLEATAN